MKKILSLCASVLLLAACNSGVKESLGLERSSPDEFAVIERAPLTLPPDFDLVPPQPGAPRPQENVTRQAKGLVLGSESSAEKVTSGSRAEQSLLEKAGASSADADIRTTVDNPEDLPPQTTAEKLGITKGKDKPLDPIEEAKSLKDQGVKTVPVKDEPKK
jgi:hypothetical protein